MNLFVSRRHKRTPVTRKLPTDDANYLAYLEFLTILKNHESEYLTNVQSTTREFVEFRSVGERFSYLDTSFVVIEIRECQIIKHRLAYHDTVDYTRKDIDECVCVVYPSIVARYMNANGEVTPCTFRYSDWAALRIENNQ